jgi:biotin carboxylase
LLLAATTGYQTRAFGEAARALGVDLVFGTDHCRGLDDPWGDQALPVRFRDDPRSLEAIERAHHAAPVQGILAVGDRPAVLAAHAARRLALPFHPPEAAETSLNKRRTRDALRAAGLPVPWHEALEIDADVAALAARLRYPSVIKPLALSGSRGVMRVDGPDALGASVERLRHILRAPDVVVQKDPAHRFWLAEEYIEGAEFAVEGLMTGGRFRVLAVFEKPDPLTGPFFEETIYVTPPRLGDAGRAAIEASVGLAAAALGLTHGPVHAECRVNDRGVFVLEAAARPIGGLCARALRFTDGGTPIPFEELLLRHALGEDTGRWTREAQASGVMMIPIPHAGVYQGVAGVERAAARPHVDAVTVTAVPNQPLVPLPEGASYLGFIFARAATPTDVVEGLRQAHGDLRFQIGRELPLARA